MAGIRAICKLERDLGNPSANPGGHYIPFMVARMRPVTVVVSLPAADAERSRRFDHDGLQLADPELDEGMVAFALPDLSLFLIERSEYAKYMEHSGVGPVTSAPGASIISCAIASTAEVDDILTRAQCGGSMPGPAEDRDGSYMGYSSDPDGHIRELVVNAHTEVAAGQGQGLPHRGDVAAVPW